MATLGEFLQTWKLKLSTTKRLLAAFHLSNKEAKLSQIQQRNPALLFPLQIPQNNIGQVVHLESLRNKLTSRVALLRRLTGSGWGTGATTLQIAIRALIHSTAEYCALVWCSSAHTRLIDPAINDA